MKDEPTDVLYDSLGLITLKTLEALGPLHGYRIARRIDFAADEAAWQHAPGIVARFCKIQDERS
jgi:hypothetical protein